MAKGGFGGNQGNMMKRAQKMQQEFMKLQQELEAAKYEGTAGGGAVKAVLMGTREFESVTIDPEAVDPDDIEMLQDMIVAAVNAALKASDDATSASMGKLQAPEAETEFCSRFFFFFFKTGV